MYAKVVDEQDKFRINSKEDISLMIQNALEEGYIDEDETEAATQPPAAVTDWSRSRWQRLN